MRRLLLLLAVMLGLWMAAVPQAHVRPKHQSSRAHHSSHPPVPRDHKRGSTRPRSARGPRRG